LEPVPRNPAAFQVSGSRRETAGVVRRLLGQRKGLSYLFDACRQVRSAVELTVIGRKPAETCAVLDRELARVRWIPSCSHQEILRQMAAHDLLVFPSLFEGFGLVLLEALAMGLPVITTPHTAGPDLIRDGVEGFIVPIRDSIAIARCLELLHLEPARLAEMSEHARRRAGDFSWGNYEETLAACVGQALSRTDLSHANRDSRPDLDLPRPAAGRGRPAQMGLPFVVRRAADRAGSGRLAIYACALAAGIFPANRFVLAAGVLALLSVGLSVAAGQSNLLVTAYGVRINYLHLPLIWIIGRVFHRRHVEQIGAFILVMAISDGGRHGAAVSRSHGRPDQSWSGQRRRRADLRRGRAHPAPGLFAFITGPQFTCRCARRSFSMRSAGPSACPGIFLSACGLAVAVALPVSISRTAMLGTGLVALAFLLTLSSQPKKISSLVRPLVLLMLVAGGLSQLPVFREGTSVFMIRWTPPAKTGRPHGATSWTARSPDSPTRFIFSRPRHFFGHGIGTGSNVGARLTSGSVGFTLAEEEWARSCSSSARRWEAPSLFSGSCSRAGSAGGLARGAGSAERAAPADLRGHCADRAAGPVGAAHRARICGRGLRPFARGAQGRTRPGKTNRANPSAAARLMPRRLPVPSEFRLPVVARSLPTAFDPTHSP